MFKNNNKMASIKSNKKYFIKSNSFSKYNLTKFQIDKKINDEGGISESRLINNNSNIKTIMNILKCKICKNILLNPYDCSKCGNTFCYNCISKLKQNKLPCPFNCKLYEITPSSFGIKKFLNQLKFYCKFKNNGCNEIISYLDIESHENSCPFNITTCPNNQCRQKIKNDMLENHIQNECPYTLFKCNNCNLNLNRKDMLLHKKICIQIKDQLDSQSPIINNITLEQCVKNNKDFQSFMNILNELNEDYFYLFEEKENHSYYQNYSNKGLITLIKCLISLFQYKFGVIENKLNNIDNNIKKFNPENTKINNSNNNSIILDSNKKNEKNEKDNSNNIKDMIKDYTKKRYKKNPIFQKQPPKIKTKIISTSRNKLIDNYNSEGINKEWETLNLEKSRIKHKILLNNLYDKEKRLEFFHNRKPSNDIKDKHIELSNNSIKSKNKKNELYFLGENNFKKKVISRNRSDIKQNMSFTNFIITKKKHIEEKIMGNKLNKSTSTFNNINKLKLNDLNNSNLFHKHSREKTYGFFLSPKEKETITNKSDNNLMENNNIYEKKVMKVISLKSYQDK